MKSVYVDLPLEYVLGHIRYGSFRGDIELTDEEYEEFKKDPAKWIEENDGTDGLLLEVDETTVDDWGPIMWDLAKIKY